MKFNLLINDPTITRAAAIVENHFHDEEFLRRVAHIPYFNFTKDTGVEVAYKMHEANLKMTVRPYKTRWAWSRVIGYASGLTIWVNIRKLDLSLEERVENFMHEPLHLLDYSHSGNTANAWNLQTVPYRVAKEFVQYLKDIGALPV